MITQIIGRLVEKTPTQVVIDCNGVGYAVNISLHTFSQINDNENIKLYTHLQVRKTLIHYLALIQLLKDPSFYF